MSEHIGNQHGFLCPNCKKGNNLSIEIKMFTDLEPTGDLIDEGDHEWDGSNRAKCRCEWSGLVSDFLTLPEGEGKILVCDDCETEWYESQCSAVDDANERFTTGDIYTEYQCPSCGALCFPMEGK